MDSINFFFTIVPFFPLYFIKTCFPFQIVEFISVLLTISNEAAEEELIRLGAIRKVLDLFFQ